MQCPNCKKEAINVNGKFVCLDCGVELNPTTTSTPAQPASIVTNHNEAPNNEAVIPSESKTEPALPNIPQTASSAAPVEEEYLNALETNTKNTDGSYDFEKSNSETVVDATPASNPTTKPPVSIPETPIPQEAAKPATYFQPETVDITPKAPENSTFDAFSTPSGIGPGEPLVDELEGPETVKEEATELFVGETPKEEIPITPPISVPDTMSVSEPVIPTATPAPDQPPTGANLDDLLNKYSAPSTDGNTPPITTPTASPAFDSLKPAINPQMNEVAPINPYQPLETQTLPATNNMPGTGNIPSAESVFGPQPGDPPEQLNGVSPPVNKKKKIIIISIVAAATVLVLVGLVFLGMSLTKPKNVKTNEQKQQEETFQISEEVSSAMDLPINMVATFDQSIDFSKVTINTIEGEDANNTAVLKLLFEKPIITKGIWQTNKVGDISLEETSNNLNIKKTYIEADKSTYIYSTEAQTWSKIEGDQIQEVPAFYPPRVKAALFYNTKVNSITEVSQENLEGNSYRKMKVVPKADIVENVLSGSNTLLSKTTYSSVNVDNLEIFAWINSSGQIYRITIKGEVVVESDLYNGTITINSTVTNNYKDVVIEKPELPTS